MKKHLLLSLFFVFSFCSLWAIPRTQKEIEAIAEEHFAKRIAARSVSQSKDMVVIPSSRIFSASTRAVLTHSREVFYVYTVPAFGFVIVSADDRLKPVLGYADTGEFVAENIPSNLQRWLQFYAKELNEADKRDSNGKSDQKVYSFEPTTTRSQGIRVAPLLEDIKWGQGQSRGMSEPFNNDCPWVNLRGRTITGCVATAMAQVMKYYNYPETGLGTKNYTTKTLRLPCDVDFSAATYDWGNMLSNYASYYANDEKSKAVSQLMYHCGVAVEMDYNLDDIGSAAFDAHIPYALGTYFRYDSNCQVYMRDYYSFETWDNLIKQELQAKRPVLYSGESTELGGHTFVLDGCDPDGLYHINWGWSGLNNGYFEMSSLNPLYPGAAGINSGGFETVQSMVIGIRKPTAESRYVSQILQDSVSLSFPEGTEIGTLKVSRESLFKLLPHEMCNMGSPFDGSIKAVLMKNGKIVKELGATKNEKLETFGNSGYASPPEFMNIPADVVNGDYQLCIVAKDNRESEWSTVKARLGARTYYNVKITSKNITFTDPVLVPNLTLTSFESNKLYEYRTGTYQLTIRNDGEECLLTLGVLLQSVADPTMETLVAYGTTSLLKGETRNITISGMVTVGTGEYKVIPLYSADQRLWGEINTTGEQVVTVNPEPYGNAVLEVVGSVQVEKLSVEVNEPLTMTMLLKNTGDVYDNLIYIYIYQEIDGDYYDVDTQTKAVFIDAGSERQITLSIVPNLPIGEYIIMLMYDDGEYGEMLGDLINFAITERTTGIPTEKVHEAFSLYPLPANEVLNITAKEAIRCIDVVALDGTLMKQVVRTISEGETYALPVSEFATGLYLLQLTTKNGVYRTKFNKK